MTLSDLANLAQIFIALAVVGSLIFVGLEIRQNTKSARSSTLQLNADHWLNYFAIISDPKFIDIYAKGSLGSDDLDQNQFRQFFLLCRATFMGMENQHYQFQNGLLDSDTYAGYQVTIREQIHAFPGIRAMWQLVRHSYGADFAAFVDKEIAEAPGHQESAFRKWKELVATQRAARR